MYTGGSAALPLNCDRSRVITMFRTIKNSTDKMYPITPFADQIVDFALHLSEESNKSKSLLLSCIIIIHFVLSGLLVVLTEKFIFLLDATKGEEFVKDEITVLRLV